MVNCLKVVVASMQTTLQRTIVSSRYVQQRMKPRNQLDQEQEC